MSRSALLFRPYSSALSRNVSIAREKRLAHTRARDNMSRGDAPRLTRGYALSYIYYTSQRRGAASGRASAARARVWTWKYLFDLFPQKSYPHELHLDYTILPFRFSGLAGCAYATYARAAASMIATASVYMSMYTHGNCNHEDATGIFHFSYDLRDLRDRLQNARQKYRFAWNVYIHLFVWNPRHLWQIYGDNYIK